VLRAPSRPGPGDRFRVASAGMAEIAVDDVAAAAFHRLGLQGGPRAVAL
jgi:hypothetical protein